MKTNVNFIQISNNAHILPATFKALYLNLSAIFTTVHINNFTVFPVIQFFQMEIFPLINVEVKKLFHFDFVGVEPNFNGVI